MSSFFATPPAPQAGASGTSLFGGGGGAAAPKPAFGGFGTQPTQPAQPTTGFAGFGAAPQQQPANPFGGFGQPAPATAPTQQQLAPTGFGGFGSTTTAAPTTAGGFTGFGAQPQQQAAAPMLGGFGQPTAQPQQFQQQQQPEPPLTRTTKFNDLREDVKNQFEMIDSFIQGRIQISKELSQRVQTQSNEDTTQPIRVVNKAVVDMGSGIESDVALARHIGDQVARANADLVLATRIVDGHKNHATGGMHLKNHASFPLDFFQREAEDLKDKLQWCKTTMEQIERKLASSGRTTGAQQATIAHTLSAQHETFMNLAGQVAVLHTEIERLKTAYTALYRSKMGAGIDPFQDAR